MRKKAVRKKGRSSNDRTPAIVKYSIPSLGNVVARIRLFKILDQARRQAAVIWLSAPAGAGKTTLAASYLAKRKLNHLWYRLDAGDADPATFFYHLGQAAQAHTPRRSPLPILTPEYLMGLPVFAANFFRELGPRLKPPVLLALDNYQDLPLESPLHELLSTGFAELPKGIAVLVLSRADPPPAYARLRAAHEFALLDVTTLQLTVAESAAIARLHQPRAVTHETAQRLHELTQGWAAGLVLMLQQKLPDLDAVAVPKGNELPAILFDYFATQVLRITEPDIQEFLRRSALLPQMTADTAAALTANTRAGDILDDLVRRNYFIVSHPGKPRAYEYHPLFREFLLADLGRWVSPEALRNLRIRAAMLLTQAGHCESAATLLIDAADPVALAKLVLAQAATLVAHGRHSVITGWIRAIPEPYRDEQPWLSYWLGTSIQWVQPLAARDHFDRAYRQFEQQNDLSACALAWCAAIDTYVVSWSEFKTLDTWLERMQRFDSKVFAALPQETQARLTVAIFVGLMYRQPDHPDMKQWAQRAENIFRSTDSIALQLSVGNHLLIYLTWWLGDMSRARQLLDALPKLGRRLGSDSKTEILSSAFQSGLCWMLADNREAIDAARHGLELGSREGFHLWDTFLACQAIFGCLSEDDLTSADTYISRISAVLDKRKYLDVAYASYVNGWYLECQGAREQALEALLFSKSVIEQVGAPFFTGAVYNDLGRMLANSGKPAEGMQLIDAAFVIGDRNDLDTIRYLALRSKAELFQNEGDEAGCLAALRGFLEIARRRGFMNHAWWRPQPMARLYAMALEHGIEPDYVTAVIQKRKLKPPNDRPVTDAWPFLLKIRTFGRFTLLRDGKPVRFEGKAQKKPLELLKLLVALGGREVAESRIIDALWPDTEADQARQNLKATVHRLRKLIGNEALLLNEGKLTLDPLQVWVDVWAFERLLNETAARLHEGHSTAAIEASRHALKLYQGPFLAADDQPFVLLPRERLRAKLLGLIGGLGLGLCQAKACGESIALYRKGLDIDPLMEAFYQGLMRCYQCLHQPAEALKTYERCRELLVSQLGVAPSSQTEILARDIRNTAG